MNKVWTFLILAVATLAFGLWLASDLPLKKPVPEKPAAESTPVSHQSQPVTSTTNGETVVELRTAGESATASFKPGDLSAARQAEERYANGSLMARGALKSRSGGTTGEWVKHGPWTNYWANGTINTFGEYANGEKIGAWPFWTEDGRLIVTNQFGAPVVVVARDKVQSTQSSAQHPAPQRPAELQHRFILGEPLPADSVLQRSPAAPTVFPADALLLKKADEFFLRGQWQEAKPFYAQFAQRNLASPERQHAMLRKALCEERLGKPGEARISYQDILKVYSKEAAGAQAQAGIAALLWQQNARRAQAIAEYEKLIKEYPDSPETAAALKLLGDWFLGQKDFGRARGFYEPYLAHFAAASDYNEVQSKAEAAQIAAAGQAGISLSTGFAEAVSHADALVARGRFAEAILLYNEVLNRFGTSAPSASYCLLQKGLCRLGLQQHNAALRDFETLAAQYPASKESPEALWRCAQTSGCLLGKPGEVRRVAQRLAKDYAPTFEAQKANFYLGLLTEQQGAKHRAQAYWAEFLRKWPQTPYRLTIQQKLARLTANSVKATSPGGNR
ncbi:MAG: tetratricopeptide repeat protein [Verrucomicrobia bacterium]|nr:tetratricopeptide repeat protein [Verrucomicrobiota bacterium]